MVLNNNNIKILVWYMSIEKNEDYINIFVDK